MERVSNSFSNISKIHHRHASSPLTFLSDTKTLSVLWFAVMVVLAMSSLVPRAATAASYVHGSIVRNSLVRRGRVPTTFVLRRSRSSDLSLGAANDDSFFDSVPPSWERITSPKNPTVKHVRSLISKRKTRTEFRSTVLEGQRLVLDALSHPATAKYVHRVLITPAALDKCPELLEVLSSRLSESKDDDDDDFRVHAVTPDVVRACRDTVTPQGVVATCAIPPPYGSDDDDVSTSVSVASSSSASRLFLLLDGVSDPGNAGTLLRSAAAAGAEAVVLLPDCADPWNPKAVRSAMGASLHVPIASVGSLDEALRLLEARGCPPRRVYAADASTASSTPHDQVAWCSGSAALCVGREGAGLSPAVRRAVVDGTVSSVHVPMERGGAVESLNAAVCGSVILFEHARQRRAAATINANENE